MCDSRSPSLVSAIQPKARARFYGPEPAGYRALNRELLEDADPVPAAGTVTNRESFAAAATVAGLDETVKVLPIPAAVRDETKTGAMAEVAGLARDGFLTALRGERKTDLARPLGASAAEHIRSRCPHLAALVTAVEGAIAGSDLFVRAVKHDRARASSTDASGDRARENLHFDAELSSLEEYDEPIFQFYLNVGREPRQFRILPLPLSAILARLVDCGDLAPENVRRMPLGEILDRYRHRFTTPLEVIPVESLHLAIFDGRVFAHDAGKASLPSLLEGRFEPSHEDDLVLALDATLTGHHRGLYHPARPFLEDLREE